jgi:hypothetical protein
MPHPSPLNGIVKRLARWRHGLDEVRRQHGSFGWEISAWIDLCYYKSGCYITPASKLPDAVEKDAFIERGRL